jgi:NTE family protein
LKKRAVVLSGGGPTGIAWQTGLAAGLRETGVDLSSADLVVGTSAGSVAGAQIALGRDLRREIESRRSDDGHVSTDDVSTAVRSASTPDNIARFVQLLDEVYTANDVTDTGRARFGEFALTADTPSEEDFLAGFAAFEADHWPPGFICTAVNARTGEFTPWDQTSDVDLAHAVASSCAVPGVFPPVTIGADRYIDGGARSLANADLAAGHDRVLVISVTGVPKIEGDSGLLRYIRQLDQEIEALRAGGSKVELVVPEDMTIAMNAMNFAMVSSAVETGLEQAGRVAEHVLDFWTS